MVGKSSPNMPTKVNQNALQHHDISYKKTQNMAKLSWWGDKNAIVTTAHNTAIHYIWLAAGSYRQDD